MTTTVVEMLTADDVGATPEDVAVALNAGSRDALAEAYQRWSTLIYTIALRSLGSHHDAEDVTQQVFVSAWRSRHTLRPSAGALPGWLVGITRHRVADVQVQRMRASRNVAAVAAAAPRENAHVVDEDLPARLMLAHELDRMGEPRASVLRLALIEDRPQDEIARRLGLPIGTVKSHVRRGLLHLRSSLEEVDHVAP
jgi:RNA polymerase sigma factor (sigma-70 family)